MISRESAKSIFIQDACGQEFRFETATMNSYKQVRSMFSCEGDICDLK